MNKLTSAPSMLAASIALALSYTPLALADNKCASTSSCEENNYVGAIAHPGALFTTRTLENSERALARHHWTFHGVADVSNEPKSTTTWVASTLNESQGIRFASGRHILAGQTLTELDKVVTQLTDKKNLKLHLLGHADAQQLSVRAQQFYADNIALSKARAAAVAMYLKQQLNLPASAITLDGKGDLQPIASNDTPTGMAQNRRVELVAWYDESVIEPVTSPVFTRETVCQGIPVAQSAFSITLDGRPVNKQAITGNADEQRCTDVALANTQLQLVYDGLSAVPALHVNAHVFLQDDIPYVTWQGYSNYLHDIDKAEIRIFSVLDAVTASPLAVVPLNRTLSGTHALLEPTSENNNASEQAEHVNTLPQTNLQYVLRVYDQQGRYDETAARSLPKTNPEHESTIQPLLTGYGDNLLTKQTIKHSNNSITVKGQHVPDNHKVYLMGNEVPVNQQGEFVAQQLLPAGLHTIELAMLDEQGNGQLFQRQVELKQNDWFYVGLADITLGQNNIDGSSSLLSQNNRDDDDLFVDGRLAFYTKGKWKDTYTVTASIDTQEQALEDIFSNLNKKDPSQLLRRLEEENHYSVYGDDSTLLEDAPTQGKFYAKIEDSQSHLMWGNFKTNISDTEFARIERGLYGANAQWQSEALTTFGEHQTHATLFAAEAGTSAAYEEFRGTGGSLYYLQNQDITQGSEQISIEIRDKDSGLVLSNHKLIAGVDYDIDAIQGRILLTKPLASTSDDSLLVRTGGVSGHPTYLVSHYEYTPGFDEIDNLTYGGRISHWLNDNWQFGVTASKQSLGIDDNQLRGLDVIYRHSADSYIKLEGAQTEGNGIPSSGSNNGGYHFSQEATALDNTAEALRVESAFAYADLGINSDGKGNFYWQKRDSGFSGLGQFSQFDTEQLGIQLLSSQTETLRTKLRVDQRDEDGGIDKLSGEFNLAYDLNDIWTISSGLRAENSTPTTAEQRTNTGNRTDLIVQLDYNETEQWGLFGFGQATLDHDETKYANNRVGVGGHYQVSDAVTLNGELSGGNQGLGANIGTHYQYDEASNLYVNYELDPDRTDNGIAGRNGQFTSGVRHRFDDALSVYGEERYQHGDNRVGLTHAYGVEYVPAKQWVLGLSLEDGKQEQAGQDTLSRQALAFSAHYSGQSFKYGGAIEYRRDKTENEVRDAYLVRNNLAYKMHPDWRAQLRIDLAISDSSEADTFNSDFTEALLGFAYRPVDNDKVNALFTYNYLYDLAPAEQFTQSLSQNEQQQRSHVVALDANYDLSARWTIGGKIAKRTGEIREGRESGQWFESNTNLYVVRADWHLVRHWDFLAEARRLEVKEAKDKRQGFLVALHRHLNQHFKVGVGYNFSDFSDDLTDLSYDYQGWFINIVGKI